MFDDFPHPIIARAGWTSLPIAIVVAVLLTGLGCIDATESVIAQFP